MAKITFFQVMLLSLAVFRLTRLVVFDKITEFIRAPFFDEVEEINEEGEKEIYYVAKQQPVLHFFGELLSCYWCTGIWASIALITVYFLWPAVGYPLVLTLAVAGMAAIIETIIQRWLTD